MALKRFFVEEKDIGKEVNFGSIAWRVGFYGGNAVFSHSDHSDWDIVLKDVKPGDQIGFEACGRDSRAFKVQPPKNPRYAILWRYGFTKPKKHCVPAAEFRGLKERIEDYWSPSGYNPDGQFVYDFNVKYLRIVDKKGRILVDTAVGRYTAGKDGFVQLWWMSSDCPLEAVEMWERLWKEHKYGIGGVVEFVFEGI